MFHIVFVEPEIPGNTGNIARTCAATGAKLHLVRPLGFNIDDKTVKRAGLDYWQYVDLEVHDSLEAFLKRYADSRKFLVTTKGSRLYTQPEYKDGDMFLFGRETAGLPKDFIAANQEMTVRIPMSKETRMRSLNLANCGNIILFEALRQMGFPGLK